MGGTLQYFASKDNLHWNYRKRRRGCLLSSAILGCSSILGMNIFGCKFCEDNDRDEHGKCILIDDDSRDRKNFDSLLWALVTVFQV